MKTFRRDKLRRLVEAGRVVLNDAYHFDDQHGESRTERAADPMPVAMKPADWHDRKEGVCYMGEWDFTSGSGCCYEAGTHEASGDLLVTLIVHSNSNYTFRIKGA